jgi:hypothetical protein
MHNFDPNGIKLKKRKIVIVSGAVDGLKGGSSD